MKWYLIFVLLAWICEFCNAADLIYTSIGIIDPNPYVGKKDVSNSENVERRRKRSTAYSSSEQQAILDKHNELRSEVSPEAADMQFMVWDDDLATLAQEWSDTCIWDHGTPNSSTTTIFNPYGQNLWLGSGTADNQPDGIGATQAWYNEVSMYTYEDRSCTGVCGHYTQVVWGDSYALGCGITFCTSTNEGHSNVWLMTCHYGPAGNYPRHPYISGSSCTECYSGSDQCYNNQCRSCDDHNEECVCNQHCHNCGVLTDDCRCNCTTGYMENDCSEVCADTHQYCNDGWYTAQCSNFDYVREGCPLMCSICDEPPSDSECVEEVTTGGNNEEETGGTTACQASCENGGTQDSDTCNCDCSNGYQGDQCEEIKEQVNHGVEITISASYSQWGSIKPNLIPAIATAINDYCNIDTHFPTCCPGTGSRIDGGNLNYIGEDNIFVGDGFPRTLNENSMEVLLYAYSDTDNDLCETGGSGEERKRRNIYKANPDRGKRNVVVYLDQDILYNAVADSVSDISAAIGYPVPSIKKGIATADEEEEPVDGDDGISDGVIAAIIIVVIIVIAVVIVIIYFVFKEKKNSQVEPTGSKVKITDKAEVAAVDA